MLWRIRYINKGICHNCLYAKIGFAVCAQILFVSQFYIIFQIVFGFLNILAVMFLIYLVCYFKVAILCLVV